MSRPILYSFYHSSCSWRVRAALLYKGIEYELKTVNLKQGEQKHPDFLKINPMGQVPVFIDNEKAIVDSSVIIEYIEDAYPQKPLMPKDLFQRAKVRQICQIISSSIQPLQSPLVAARYSPDDTSKQTEWIHFYLNKGFSGLEKVLQESSGKYCVGNDLSLADLCLVPQIYNAEARFKFDMKEFPVIHRVYQTLMELDIFKMTHPNKHPGYPNPSK